MTKKMRLNALQAIANSTTVKPEFVDRAKQALQNLAKLDEIKKKRFDFLKKVTKGQSNRLSWCLKGKNRSQRQRLIGSFMAMQSKHNGIRFDAKGNETVTGFAESL